MERTVKWKFTFSSFYYSWLIIKEPHPLRQTAFQNYKHPIQLYTSWVSLIQKQDFFFILLTKGIKLEGTCTGICSLCEPQKALWIKLEHNSNWVWRLPPPKTLQIWTATVFLICRSSRNWTPMDNEGQLYTVYASKCLHGVNAHTTVLYVCNWKLCFFLGGGLLTLLKHV